VEWYVIVSTIERYGFKSLNIGKDNHLINNCYQSTIIQNWFNSTFFVKY